MTDTANFNDLSHKLSSGNSLSKLGCQIIGLLIIIASVLTCIALASWNVEDPSLTHATSQSSSNLLGFIGSSLADILLQFFGIAGVILALLPAIWGWQMFRLRLRRVRLKQITYFFVIIFLTSGFAACLPVPETWPMPTGLGGITGNGIVAIPFLFFSDALSGYLSPILAILLALPVPFLFPKAFYVAKMQKETVEAHEVKISKADHKKIDKPKEAVVLPMILGAVTHTAYSMRAKAKHQLASRRTKMQREHVPQHDLTMDDGKNSSHLSGALSALSTLKRKLIDEPVADDGLGEYLDGSENLDKQYEEPAVVAPIAPETAQPQPQGIAAPQHEKIANPSTSTRVSPPAEKPKPSKAALAQIQKNLPGIKDPSDFELPPLHLLTEAPDDIGQHGLSEEALAQNAQLLEGVLDDFGVKGEIVHVRPGPVVTLYELEPAPGIKSSRVIGLADDIARSMSAIAARVAVIPGKNAIGIELPNAKRETVYFHESVASDTFETNKGKLPICLGKTIGGEPVIADLAGMPHLLVAGTTGSGKSVAINTMILSLLFRMTPEECKLIMIDPKMLELSIYDGIPHLLTPVVTDPKKAVVALKWTVREMEDRYRKMSKVGVRNIDGFNTRVKQAVEKNEPIVRTIQTGYDQETGEAIYEREELDLSPLPYIVVLIDEMADLMMVAGKDIEGTVQRLAQMARAAGIHVIMATQRPSVDVITGTIKANFPTRISFQVTSKIDSRTILGEQGAEQLLGMGDMLYMAGGGRIQRVHGPFVSDEEVEEIVNHLKDQGIPQYLGAVTEDIEEDEGTSSNDGSGNVTDSSDPYDQAVAIVLRDKKASTSYIQRRLGIGYNRAATIIERMEEEGVVGPANHAGKREILVGSDPEDDFNFSE
ncbi:MAG: DNA translocase FtsK [Hyphomicrobiales bacterium]